MIDVKGKGVMKTYFLFGKSHGKTEDNGPAGKKCSREEKQDSSEKCIEEREELKLNVGDESKQDKGHSEMSPGFKLEMDSVGERVEESVEHQGGRRDVKFAESTTNGVQNGEIGESRQTRQKTKLCAIS